MDLSNFKKIFIINNYDNFLNIIEYICDKQYNKKTRLILIKFDNKIIKIKAGEGYSRPDVNPEAECIPITIKDIPNINPIVHCSYNEYYYNIMKEGLMTKERIGKQGEILSSRHQVHFYEVTSFNYNAFKDLINNTGRNTFYYTTINTLLKNEHIITKSQNGVVLVKLDKTQSINSKNFTWIDVSPLDIIKNNEYDRLIKYLKNINL